MKRSHSFSGLVVWSLIALLGSASGSHPQSQDHGAAASTTPQAKSSAYAGPDGISVDQLIYAMLARNLELRAARQRLAEAEGRLVQSGLRPNPSVEFQQLDDRLLSNNGEREQELAFHQPLELFGKRSRRIELARAELERIRYEVQDGERRQTADLALLVGQALSEVSRLYALERVSDLNESLRSATALRVRVGDASRYEFSQVEAESARLDAEKLRATTRLEGLLLQIKTLAGMSPDDSLKLNDSEFGVQAVEVNLAEALRIAADTRPDLKAASIAEREAEARIKLAESERAPELGAILGYKRTSSAGAGPVPSSDWQFRAGVSVTLPLFNRNQGLISEGAAALEEARLHRESLEQIVRRDVTLAMRRLDQVRREVRLYEDRLLPLGQDSVRMAKLGFDLGEVRLGDYVLEQRRLADAETAYVQAKADLFQARVEVERAIGRRLQK